MPGIVRNQTRDTSGGACALSGEPRRLLACPGGMQS